MQEFKRVCLFWGLCYIRQTMAWYKDKLVKLMNKDTNEVRFVRKNKKQVQRKLELKKFSKKLKKRIVFKEAKKIKCPTLIIHGTADDLVPIWQSEELVKRIPNAKLESIKEADHIYSNKEHDEIFNNLTIKFFKENA